MKAHKKIIYFLVGILTATVIFQGNQTYKESVKVHYEYCDQLVEIAGIALRIQELSAILNSNQEMVYLYDVTPLITAIKEGNCSEMWHLVQKTYNAFKHSTIYSDSEYFERYRELSTIMYKKFVSIEWKGQINQAGLKYISTELIKKEREVCKQLLLIYTDDQWHTFNTEYYKLKMLFLLDEYEATPQSDILREIMYCASWIYFPESTGINYMVNEWYDIVNREQVTIADLQKQERLQDEIILQLLQG